MKFVQQGTRSAVAALMIALAACGGGGAGDSGTPSAGTVVGAAGGTVALASGAKVEVPAGALAADTTIAIEATTAGAPALPTDLIGVGQMFAFTPHGLSFATPVTLTLPFDPAAVPAGKTPKLFKTNAQNQWEPVAGAIFSKGSVSAQVTGFSNAQVVVAPLESFPPFRSWSFSEYRGDALNEVELNADTQDGGELYEVHDFGFAFDDFGMPDFQGGQLPPDGIATGEIYSSADGISYSVFSEAPFGIAANDEPIGGISRLAQTQSFIKRAADATLQFTLSAAFIDAIDRNGSALVRLCPPGREQGFTCDYIKGEVYLDVRADTATRNLFHTAGGATLNGGGGAWEVNVWNFRFSRTPLWSLSNFDQVGAGDNGPLGRFKIKLAAPRTYSVDLSSVAVGEAFTLTVETSAHTYNRVAGPPSEFTSSVGAYLRDPLQIGGSTLIARGLEASSNLQLPLPAEAPVTPAACVPGPAPDPAAGVLQFSAASFSSRESNTTPVVVVTRSGGSRGAVTATVASSDGTARAGTDYKAVLGSVFFEDGDAEPRFIDLPMVQNRIGGEADRTVNLLLSEPGGCAALGAQTTATLTIQDDGKPPPVVVVPGSPGSPGTLDASFGAAGMASSSGFGGDRSAMALQADGKIVMVGGTFTDFILARFNADGSLDSGFGVGGKVTTDMVSGEGEEALGVAIQSDGRIVVVGTTGTPGPGGPVNFALARYNANGSLDASFGTGGKVSSGVIGRAFAVAIQPDGRIVVAGDEPTIGDVALARYNANGSLDASFGSGGQLTTDIAGVGDIASNIALQPNGAIVVSGGSSVGLVQTGLARYNANGNLDASFGAGGKLVLAGVSVGDGLALQGDGKFVLVGNVTVGVFPASSTRFALMRLNANGSTDTAFGSGGVANTAFTVNAAAAGVALQRDGKIVAVGTTVLKPNPDFVVARYNGDGSIDPGFGNGGVVSVDFFGSDDIGESVLLQPDGKIVVGGQARNNVDGYGVARVNP